MIEQFKKVIEENLPQQVGETLQKRLLRCDDLEIEVEELKSLKNKYQQDLHKTEDVLKEKIDEIGVQKRRLENIEDRELEVRSRMTTLITREETCKLKEEHCKEMVLTIKEMYAIPFQNRVVRESCHFPVKVRNDYLEQGEYNSNTQMYEKHLRHSESIENEGSTKETEEK